MSFENKYRQPRDFRVGFPSRVHRYIAKEYLLSFIIAFAFFFVVFFVNQILLMAEDILSRHTAFGQVALLLLFSLPSVIAIAFPFSTLAGALMASARLNSDNEVLAFSASGVSALQMFFAYIILGLMISLVSFASNDYFLPRGSANFAIVYSKLLKSSAAVEFAPWSVKKFPEATVVSGPAKSGKIERIVVIDTNDPRGKGVVFAQKAGIDVLPGAYNAVLDLENVWEQRLDPGNQEKFSISKAENVRYKIALQKSIEGYQGPAPAEMSSAEMLRIIRSKSRILDSRENERTSEQISVLEGLSFNYRKLAGPRHKESSPAVKSFPLASTNLDAETTREVETIANLKAQIIGDRSLQLYRLEYNKKLSIPFAGFFFSLLAFPLGLGSKRAGKTAGFGIALLISAVYWGLIFIGQTFGIKSGLDPVLATWSPNLAVLIAAASVWVIRRKSSRRAV